MSKYKYSSLLSSQYRQVFKSYHSLDRSEQELKNNLAKSLHKRIHTEITQVEAKNSGRHYQKPKFQIPNRKPQPYLYYKTQPKYATLPGAFVDRRDLETYPGKLEVEENLRIQNRNNQYQSFLSEQKFYPASQQYTQNSKFRETTNYHPQPNQFKNYELKMKVSEINKRRNDIKLKVRVNDIDRIKKKYEYLNENSQQTQIFQNQRLQKQDEKQKPIQRSPLIETSNNRVFSTNIKPTKEGARISANKSMDEENIQTPHFHQTEVRKQILEPSLISLKLQNLVKNTFTDRY